MISVKFSNLLEILEVGKYEFVGIKNSVSISSVKTDKDASSDSIVWVKSDNTNSDYLNSIKANLVVISNKINRTLLLPHVNYILVENPKLTFALIVNYFFIPKNISFVHPSAQIDENVKIGKNVYIGPNVVISKNSFIGNNTRILGNTFIYENVIIGQNCILNAGCVIGAPGSGYVKDNEGKWNRFPQIGKTIIEDNVEIGALSYVNKGAIGETRIKSGTKIGLSVCIGHNVSIGHNCMIIANSVVGGSSIIEDDVWVSHGAVIRNKIVLGKSSFIGMEAVVTKNVGEGQLVAGNPAKKLIKNN
jgi:UDP-3-O-[3-hydroxymyristoyl] glucosamine N-acyltransferase